MGGRSRGNFKAAIWRGSVWEDDGDQKIALKHVVRFVTQEKNTIKKKLTVTRKGFFGAVTWRVE